MTTLIILVAAAISGAAVWAMFRTSRREKPGPSNNWRNEDYMSREADGT